MSESSACLITPMSFSFRAVFGAPTRGSSLRSLLVLWNLQIHGQTVSYKPDSLFPHWFHFWVDFYRSVSGFEAHANVEPQFPSFSGSHFWDIIMTRRCNFVWRNWSDFRADRVDSDPKVKSNLSVNPFTAPACIISGMKSAHIHACKQYSVLDGPVTHFTFNTVYFYVNLFTCSCVGGKLALMASNLAPLLVVFRVTARKSWQWKG